MPEADNSTTAEKHMLAAMKDDVTGGGASSGGLKAWADYVDALKPAGEVNGLTWFAASEQNRAEVYRQLVMNLSQAYFWFFQATPEHPDWMPFENSVFMLQPNPDGIYHIAPVDGAGVYRVAGWRGSNRVMGFATGHGLLGSRKSQEAKAAGRPGLNNYDADGLTLGEDGSFEVIFSQERPAGWTGDWRYLDPYARSILVRQFSYDWGVEQEARFAIERLDVPAKKPRLSVAEIDERLDEVLGDFAHRFSSFVARFQSSAAERLGLNVMELSGFEDVGNSPEWPQKYWRCFYDLQPGEALVVETEIPEGHYWNVQLNDPLWNQIEFAYRQSSLNGHQARLDSDGRFRAVISAEDPGVPNWLDTAGFQRGMLVGRWYRAETHPMPTMRKVRLDEVHGLLPADTPRVSEAERDAAIRKRNFGVQLRRRW